MGMTYFYEIIFKLYGEIIQPYNIGHTDLDVFVCKSFCHRYNNPGMTILHEIVITRAVVGQRAHLLGTFYIVTFLSLSHII